MRAVETVLAHCILYKPAFQWINVKIHEHQLRRYMMMLVDRIVIARVSRGEMSSGRRRDRPTLEHEDGAS